jgi:RAT1-interacting protein
MVGFRTPAGHLTTTQSFKTMHIPRLVRGKPGAWDPAISLEWGSKFLTFMRDISNYMTPDTAAAGDGERRAQVWRVKFVPRTGVEVGLLDEKGVLDVVGGEERVGFLPTWFWNEVKEMKERTAYRSREGGLNGSSVLSQSHSSGLSPTTSTRSARELKPPSAAVPAGWKI